MRTMRSVNNSGHSFIEYAVILLLLLISLAVGMGQYQRHGLKGLVLGTLAALIGMVLLVAGIIAIGNALGIISQKYGGQKWYRVISKSLQVLFWFCFFSFIAAFFCFPILFRFDLSPDKQEILLNLTVPFLGLLGTWAHYRFKQAFWPEFGRLCLFLSLSLLGAILGMAVGALLQLPLSAYLHVVDLGALLPMGIYIFLLLRKHSRKDQ